MDYNAAISNVAIDSAELEELDVFDRRARRRFFRRRIPDEGDSS